MTWAPVGVSEREPEPDGSPRGGRVVRNRRIATGRGRGSRPVRTGRARLRVRSGGAAPLDDDALARAARALDEKRRARARRTEHEPPQLGGAQARAERRAVDLEKAVARADGPASGRVL